MGKPVSDVLTQSSVQTRRTDAQAAGAVEAVNDVKGGLIVCYVFLDCGKAFCAYYMLNTAGILRSNLLINAD